MTTTPLTVSRVFKAPVARVRSVRTDPVRQAKWLSPGNLAGYQSRMDFRVGGQHFYGIPAPDGSGMSGSQNVLQSLIAVDLVDESRLMIFSVDPWQRLETFRHGLHADRAEADQKPYVENRGHRAKRRIARPQPALHFESPQRAGFTGVNLRLPQ